MNMGTLRKRVRRAWNFVRDDVWDVELGSLTRMRAAGVRVIRVFVLVFRGFRDDECPMHAASLTFNSLMAIVPILALALSLARVFGGAELAREKVQGAVFEWTQRFGATEATVIEDGVENTEAAAAVDLATQINGLVDDGFEKVSNISFGALGGVGLVILFWMVISVLGRVEKSFNRVWGVQQGRSLWRKFTDYLSVLLILPFLVIAASTLPVMEVATRFLGDTLAQVIRAVLDSGFLKHGTVVLMSTLTFMFIIMFMPNTRVRTLPALGGGFVSAILFLVWLMICAKLQVGAAKYGAIYGSFAIVPILLAWVNVSWQIVLFGAEVAFASQNSATYRMERGAAQASALARMRLALSVTVEAGRAMVGQREALEISAYATEQQIPVRLLNAVVDELERAGLLGALAPSGSSYVLLKSPSCLPVSEVIDAILSSGTGPEALGPALREAAVDEVMTRAESDFRGQLGSTTIQDLLDRQAA